MGDLALRFPSTSKTHTQGAQEFVYLRKYPDACIELGQFFKLWLHTFESTSGDLIFMMVDLYTTYTTTYYTFHWYV